MATSSQKKMESIAKLLIIDSKNRALILTLGKHLKYPEKSYLPDLPGGIVDAGESELAAAVREAREECGIQLKGAHITLAYTNTTYYEQENKSVTKLLYIAHLEDTPLIKLSWEHSNYAWIPIDELSSVDLRGFFKEAIEYSMSNHLITVGW